MGYGATSPPDGYGHRRNGERLRDRASRDSSREREGSQGRDRQRGRNHGHRDIDRGRSGSERYEREYDFDRDRDRERDPRHRSRDREHRSRKPYEHDGGSRESRHRHRTRSRSRGTSRDHSKSRSRSRSRSRNQRSKRASGFDMAPPGVAVIPTAATLPGLQLAGLSQAMSSVLPGAFPFSGTQFGALSMMPMQAVTQQATRHARRVYVGGLPALANEQTIATFFSQVMAAIGGNTAGPGDAVVNVYINREKNFAFVEMRTVEEASNAMALDGVRFEGMSVRVRRPTDYQPTLAATLGPSQPSPHLNLAAVELTSGAARGADGPDKIFVGGLPHHLTEAQVKELLEIFGPLRGIDLVKDWETGNSKGYAFCVYQDPAVTDVACAALNGYRLGDKTFTVRRATASGQSKPDDANVLLQARQQIAMQAIGANVMAFTGLPGLMPGFSTGLMSGMMTGNGNGISATEVATKVVCLTQLVAVDELRDDTEFKDIYKDIKDECDKFGTVSNLVIPRPSPTQEKVPGLGKAFVEYTDIQSSGKAKASLDGRKFAGNTVVAVYYPEDKFLAGDYDG